MILQLATDLKTAELWHHYIEQQQVGLELPHLIQGIATVDGRFDLAVDIDKVGFEQFTVGRVIVRDQNSMRCHTFLVRDGSMSESVGED
jgi:hypothetical protein